MNRSHITSTTDPINGFNITDLKNRPHVVEGDNDLTIYFESKPPSRPTSTYPLSTRSEIYRKL